MASEIKDRIKKKDVEGTITLINTAPNALAWKDPKHYNSTLFHHAAWRNAAGLITATLKVFKISNELIIHFKKNFFDKLRSHLVCRNHIYFILAPRFGGASKS